MNQAIATIYGIPDRIGPGPAADMIEITFGDLVVEYSAPAGLATQLVGRALRVEASLVNARWQTASVVAVGGPSSACRGDADTPMTRTAPIHAASAAAATSSGATVTEIQGARQQRTAGESTHRPTAAASPATTVSARADTAPSPVSSSPFAALAARTTARSKPHAHVVSSGVQSVAHKAATSAPARAAARPRFDANGLDDTDVPF